jgi:peptidoglycan/xylan/chitin deacetylase (PgdA/CDA1 family)
MYHSLEPKAVFQRNHRYTLAGEAFENQLDFLKQHEFRTITFAELFRLACGALPVTGREILITFDDGYDSFHSIATPALLARGMTATVFLVAGCIGGINDWDSDSSFSRNRPLRLMDQEAIREVIASGMEIGIHGWKHRDLTLCSKEEAGEEVVSSKEHVERLFGVHISVFAYPFGRFTGDHFDILRNAGYLGAVSIFSDQPYVTSNPYAMRRIYVHSGDGPARFRVKLTQLYLRYKAFREYRHQTWRTKCGA